MIRKNGALIFLGTWILTILLVAGMVLTFFCSEAVAARSDFKVNVDSELSNDSEYYIVSMDIENSGKDFSGTVRLAVDLGGTSVGYDVDISIPSGSTKTYKVNVPSMARTNSNVVEVQIYDQKGKKEYAEKFQSLFVQNNGTLKFGILSNNPDALYFMDLGGSRIVVNGQNYYVGLEEAVGSKLSEDIDSLAGLIINDYDTSTLSDETIAKIENWTNQGGILIFGSGSHAEEVISGFDQSFLGFKFSSSYTSKYNDENGYETEEEYEIASFDYYSGKYYFDSNLSYSASSGSGMIVSYCIDLAEYREEDYQMADCINSMYQDVIGNTRDLYNNKNYSNLNVYTLETLQGYMEKPAKSASVLLVLLIIAYTALVGPIAYLILKAMKMREKIWLVIPALSLVFVLFVFLVSLGIRVKGITLKSVNVVNLDSNKEDCYLFGYAPDPEEWDIKTNDEYDYACVLDSYSYSGTEKVDMAVKKSDGGEKITFYPDSAFDTRCAVLSSRDSGNGNFKLDVSISGNSNNGLDDLDDLEEYEDYDYDYYSSSSVTGIDDGTVENTTGIDFDFVMIITQAGAQLEEDVKNGDKIKIDLDSTSYNYASYSFGYDHLNNDYTKKYYDKKDYDSSGAIASMILAEQTLNTSDCQIIVLGVKESKSKTDQNEKSWDVYYSYY
ncbi:hypothetical protein SAMN02910369_00596 [Lachnospiraceae bacterium NE2001]|nr:hypothetical protein SAMN02910369_00596 [Lachnospiraceae bacterium NE2001]